jgi:hypothetical protein
MPTVELCRTDGKRRVGVALLEGVVRASPQNPFGIVCLLQGLEESEQAVIRLETCSRAPIIRLELRQRGLLECKVSVQIRLCGRYRLVAKPQSDHRGIDACLQQLHRGTVP